MEATKLQWPQENTALAKVVKEKPFVELALPSQQNAVGLALIDGWQTTSQKGFEIVTALKNTFGKTFPSEAHPTKAGVKCDVRLNVTVIDTPTIKDWKLGAMISKVEVTLSASSYFATPLHAVWQAKPEAGAVASRMQTTQVGLMALLLKHSGDKVNSVSRVETRTVVESVESLLAEWNRDNASSTDRSTLENIKSVLTYIRENGISNKDTADLKGRIELAELKIALLLEDKTQVQLSSPPKASEAPPQGAPITPTPPQPSRGKLYPFLAVVGCLAAAGFAYKAYMGGLTLPKWLSWESAAQTKRVVGGR